MVSIVRPKHREETEFQDKAGIKLPLAHALNYSLPSRGLVMVQVVESMIVITGVEMSG